MCILCNTAYRYMSREVIPYKNRIKLIILNLIYIIL